MSLLKSASIVSMMTLVSRISGLVRELLIASAFGASATTDAFNVAFRIPNLLRRLFAEGAFSQAFVPILAESRNRQGDEATHAMVNAVATVLALTLGATCVLGVIGAPAVVWVMASGLKASGGFDAAVVMTRWMFPYIGFMSLVALSAGILNTWGQFAIPAATPILLNVAMILAAALGAPALRHLGIEPVYALALGVMVGGILQLAVQWPALRRLGMVPHLRLGPQGISQAWHHPGVRRVLRQMAPAVMGVSVAQLSLLVNTQIASHLGAGAVSWLTYADRLMEFPTSMLGVAVGVVLLPQLSRAQARGDRQEFSELLDWGLRLVLMMALPCAVGLLVFAKPMVAVLYHYGHFSAHDVDQTVKALSCYGVGLMGLIGVKVLAPGYYANQDIRTPVRIGISVLVVTQVFNAIFVPFLGHAGLALSIGLGSLVNAAWLLLGLKRSGRYLPQPGWTHFALRVVGATLVVGVMLWLLAHRLDWIALRQQALMRVGAMAATMSVAAGLYFGLLRLSGMDVRAAMRR